MAVEIDRKEIYRYLGYRGREAEAATRALVETCVTELTDVAEPKVVKKEYLVTVSEDGTINFGCFSVKSKNLAKNLGGCGQVLLIAVTLGLGVDRLLAKYGKLQVSKAVVMQAAAAAMIEAFCNERCLGWRREYAEKGLYMRPRFSPGYGDFPLECQGIFLRELDAGKWLGITLTDGGLMVPTKSVTAVIGLSEAEQSCKVEGCELCGKINCLYRRG